MDFETQRWDLPGAITVRFTGVAEGDLSARSPGAAQRRRAVVDLPWSVPRQVHGRTVFVVERPGAGNGTEADALVTALPGVAIGVVTADCAPVALGSPEGIAGVAHAGWRGLEAGVIQATIETMRRLGATEVTAVLGPCIHAGCYEFGATDLDRVAARLGPSVRARYGARGAALDVPAAVAAAVAAGGAELAGDADVCTACSDRHWSWRARSDAPRQATVVWRQ
jgi:YfiH family protein